MNRKFFEALAVLTGTIIGAGVLGIPFVIAKAGFLTGLVTMIFVGSMLVILNLYLGEISSRTKGKHELVGYAEKYIGPKGKKLMTVSMLIGIYGALIAYLIGVSSSINAMLGVNNIVAMVAFFVVASLLVYKGLKAVSKWELLLSSITLSIILIIFFMSFGHFNVNNLAGFDWKKLFIPYGVIFFAFLGTAAIPEVKSILESNKRDLRKAIIVGSSIPIVAYILFAIGVLAVTGKNTTEIATIGLGNTLGSYMLVIGNLFAILAMSTSFLSLGLALFWVYRYDYKLNAKLSWALTVFPAFVVALSGLTGFVQVIGISGAVAGGIDGLLILLMHRNAKRLGEVKPSYEMKSSWFISGLLCLIFIGGIVYTVLSLL